VSTWVIVNPKAGSGRALEAGKRLSKALSDATLIETTREAGAEPMARRARREGVGRLVVVGGDGTISQAVAGLTLSEEGEPLSPGPSLAVLPAGTGGDYRKTFGWSENLNACVERLAKTPTYVDVGRISVTADDGLRRTTTFANVLSFGLGGLTDRIVESGPKWLGGRAAFYLGAVAAVMSYDAAPLELIADGTKRPVEAFQNVAVCLGKYFGGGMKIAPMAEPSDGWFEVITIGGGRLKALSLSADIYRGKHLEREHVSHFRAKTLSVRATRPAEVLVDCDGEVPGQLPLEIDLLPRALPLLA
jgi:YegS/Rv2252/BmrU family lipid kinase